MFSVIKQYVLWRTFGLGTDLENYMICDRASLPRAKNARETPDKSAAKRQMPRRQTVIDLPIWLDAGSEQHLDLLVASELRIAERAHLNPVRRHAGLN